MADDIVCSAAPVTHRSGAYFRNGPAHLYRIRAGVAHQLTSVDMDDTDPCRAPDGKHILFWRRDRQDLIGRTWLCSILADGTNLRVLKRIGTADIGSPLEKSVNEKPLTYEDLPGIPSGEGGTDAATNIARLQDGIYVFGYYSTESELGLANEKGEPIRRLRTYRMVRGKKRWVGVSGDEQWEVNPDGAKAFWFGRGHSQILLQKVSRNETGGHSHLFFIDAHAGRISREIDGEFIQDVDRVQSSFLTTSWRWGNPSNKQDSVPLQSLKIWKHGRQGAPAGPADSTCLGACFVSSTLPMPRQANRNIGFQPKPPSPNAHEVIFSASKYGDNLGNVYQSAESHLYRIRTDGTGLQQLTKGRDYQPALTKDGKHILFWRNLDDRYRLYSMTPDGKNQRALGPSIADSISQELGPAMLHARRGSVRVTDEQYPGNLTLLDRRGRAVAEHEETLFSPDGTHALVRFYNRSDLVDLTTFKATHLSSYWRATGWIDNRTIVGMHADHETEGGKPTPGEIAYLDLKGKPSLRKKVSFAVTESDDGMMFEMLGFGSKSFPLWKHGLFMWQAHHSMSDGGYEYLELVDIQSGAIKDLGEQAIEGVALDGRSFVGSDYSWVGGYKGAGAEKLAEMNIWDAKSLACHPFGFRRMICNGACILPKK